MAKLITGTTLGTTTVTFTTSQTWTCPAGVVTLLTAVGKGQDGTAATGGGYGPNTHQHQLLSTVQGVEGGAFPNHRVRYWSSSQSDLTAARDAINVGGNGSYTATNVLATWEFDTSKGDCSVYSTSPQLVTWTNALPNSAYVTVDSGWQTTGSVNATDSGISYIDWDEVGTYSGGTAATTGSNTTGFSKTWNGGVGIAATSTTYYNITVVPATGYPMVVPTGGYISITY